VSIGNCARSTFTSFWIEKEVLVLRNRAAATPPSLTTARSALPDFSLSSQPAGTPPATTAAEKSPTTTRSAARAG
jgi:hypothetical protein